MDDRTHDGADSDAAHWIWRVAAGLILVGALALMWAIGSTSIRQMATILTAS